MPELPSVCVIGAGSSGIAAAKALHERGIPFDCFEKSDRVGGNWVFGNKNGMSSAYRSLHINTSRERMEYADFPMPKSYPDFPHHTQIAAYFDAYVDRFGFRDRIRFETGVEHAAREADGTWTIALDTGETRRYDALVVANGHHWDPRWPEPPFPGSFDGDADARALLRRQRAVQGQTRRRRGDRQQRDGHRGRVELRRRADVPLLAPRRAHHPQVPVRPAARPDRRQPLHRRAAVGASARRSSRRFYRARRRAHGGLRPAEARPRPRRRAPDDLRRLPQPHRPRRDRLQAERRGAARRSRALRGRLRRAGRRDRLLHGLQGHVPVLRRRT